MSTFAAPLCAWLASFKIEGMGGYGWTLQIMMICDGFVSSFLCCGFVCCCLCRVAGLLNFSALGIGILDVRSSILGENGCNAFGLTSALEGRQQYMEELQMVCKKKLSTMVLLAERKKTVIFV
jgi:hypothetical protein